MNPGIRQRRQPTLPTSAILIPVRKLLTCCVGGVMHHVKLPAKPDPCIT
ncbi:putative nAD/FAD-utilizing enzyme apparently [Mycobacterium sp. MAC_080597_8934]|nr:putative nAD/FAD-utilizing enzyme apparently [Mycobacterium avium MAV_120809_2495]ETZ59524.1 putative nAD/FAD-utilizing enzyme apparently [Mycobacterium sp. MAC_080597_8934]